LILGAGVTPAAHRAGDSFYQTQVMRMKGTCEIRGEPLDAPLLVDSDQGRS